MTALSVNVNKIAWLRNAREGALPNLAHMAQVCIEAGCHGITVHPRPDGRHIRPGDVLELHAMIQGRGSPVEFNIEGNPFEGPTDGGYPGYIQLVERAAPDQATLVPDAPGQLTSDHGWRPTPDNLAKLAPLVERLHATGARVSVFVDAGVPQLDALAAAGIDRVELYTGPYAEEFAAKDNRALSAWLGGAQETVSQAQALGLGINAGHDLDQKNLGLLLRELGAVDEVSIGHALISEALLDGLATTVARYVELVQAR